MASNTFCDASDIVDLEYKKIVQQRVKKLRVRLISFKGLRTHFKITKDGGLIPIWCINKTAQLYR